MKKIAVLLSGCGVYDGSEIQEAVFTLLEISRNGGTYHCFAPNIMQHHVVNHTNGEEMNETRNVLVESARIARGEIKNITDFKAGEFDALVIPGGFGTAKNLTKWALSGPDGEIDPAVRSAILDCIDNKKAMAALCMGPTVIAKALQGSSTHPVLSVGTSKEASPYDIAAITAGMKSTGANTAERSIREISIDKENRIVCAPCYMMEGSITEVYNNTKQAITALFEMI